MKYKLKMMGGDELYISEETFNKIASLPTLTGPIKIQELGGIINLSSMVSLLSEDVANEASQTRRQLHDGLWVIKKYGQWVPENNPEARIDYRYYPELAKDTVDKPIEKMENIIEIKKLSQY